jgi:nucleoside-diphosphate-sugar epimerase
VKVLITGAAGFIGTALRLSLERDGHDIVAISRGAARVVGGPRTEWISIDLGQPAVRLPDIDGVDAVVYLAQSRDYRNFPGKAVDIFQINASALLMTLDWSCAHGVRSFVYASSANVYAPSHQALTESSPLRPASFYGHTKLIGEQLAAAYAGSLCSVVLRLFSVYGPEQAGMLVPDLIDRVRTGTPIDVQGTSGLTLTPVFVADVVACIDGALRLDRTPGIDVMNVGGPGTIGIREMGQAIGDALGVEPVFRQLPGPEPPGFVADTTHLRARLGFAPPVRFDEGIRKTIHVSSETPGTTTRS